MKSLKHLWLSVQDECGHLFWKHKTVIIVIAVIFLWVFLAYTSKPDGRSTDWKDEYQQQKLEESYNI